MPPARMACPAGWLQDRLDSYLLAAAPVQPAVPPAQGPAMAQPGVLPAQHASTSPAQQHAGLAGGEAGGA